MIHIIYIIFSIFLQTQKPSQVDFAVVSQIQSVEQPIAKQVLSSKELSLTNRHKAQAINEVFKKNILLNLAYLNESVRDKSDVNWKTVDQPFVFSMTLNPGETFAYHDDVLSKYEDSVVKTTNSYFNEGQGFISSGFLFGDGVCHLASIINWAAQDAGLSVEVTKLHSIAPIPDIPDKYGVSIYTIEGVKGSGARNNLYITNTKEVPVTFHFNYQNNQDLIVEVIQNV